MTIRAGVLQNGGQTPVEFDAAFRGMSDSETHRAQRASQRAIGILNSGGTNPYATMNKALVTANTLGVDVPDSFAPTKLSSSAANPPRPAG